ncbi:MAG: DMT family transporter [Anaerolineae bacterium]|nr:DMT family transporter [Anaerolineae bacterium]
MMPNVLLIAILLILDSLHFVFARLLLPHIVPGASTLFVLTTSTVEVGVYGLVTGKLRWDVARRYLGLFGAIGLLIALSVNINYEAVAYIDPGTASLLSQTAVLFSLGFGLIWLRDRLSTIQIGGAALAIVGVFVVAFQPGDYLRLGSLLIVSSALMYALHAAITKRFGDGIDLLNFFFFRLLFTTGALAIIGAVRGVLVWPSLQAWPLILLVGTVDIVLSRTLYYLALRRLTISMHTLALTLSPIAASLWGLALFGTLPTPQQILGGGIVIAGVLIVSLSRAPTTPQPDPT